MCLKITPMLSLSLSFFSVNSTLGPFSSCLNKNILWLDLTSTFCLQCPNLFCLWLFQSPERLKENSLGQPEPDNQFLN